MSYFAGYDTTTKELIPDNTKLLAKVDGYEFKEARNGKKYLDITFKVIDDNYRNRKLWKAYWFDNDKQKYDPQGLWILTRICAESKGDNFNEVKESIDHENDIVNYVVDTELIIEVALHSYEKLDGSVGQVNRIRRLIAKLDTNKLPVKETKEEVENELEINDESMDLPF